jgi:uncharacterized membrane protein YphA (DoxX/SURF4 family)
MSTREAVEMTTGAGATEDAERKQRLGRFTADKPERPMVVRILVLIARLVVAYFVVSAGIGKLVNQPVQAAMFTDLGGRPMQYTVGTFEVLGGLAVLVPILSGIAAIGLTALFLIVVSVNTVVFGPETVGLAVLVLVLSATIGYLQRHQTVRLVRFLARFLRRRAVR